MHKCWGCGKSVTECGHLCMDCSWEEHLAKIAHTGEFDEVRSNTPPCCIETRKKVTNG